MVHLYVSYNRHFMKVMFQFQLVNFPNVDLFIVMLPETGVEISLSYSQQTSECSTLRPFDGGTGGLRSFVLTTAVTGITRV